MALPPFTGSFQYYIIRPEVMGLTSLTDPAFTGFPVNVFQANSDDTFSVDWSSATTVWSPNLFTVADSFPDTLKGSICCDADLQLTNSSGGGSAAGFYIAVTPTALTPPSYPNFRKNYGVATRDFGRAHIQQVFSTDDPAVPTSGFFALITLQSGSAVLVNYTACDP